MKKLLSLIFLATVLFMAPAKAEVQYVAPKSTEGFFESLLDLVSSNSKTASSSKIETSYTAQSVAAVNNAANCNTNNNSKTESTKTESTKTETSVKLPINNGMVFLMMAGLVIGIFTVNKSKQFKLSVVKA